MSQESTLTFTIQAAPLEALARDIFAAAGAPDDIAAAVAQSLVMTNLLGHDSHGVLRVTQYISMIRRGMIQPAERPRIRKRFGATAMVTLGYGFGQIGARFAAELAIEMAREHGIAAVSLGQATHVGRLGEWTGMIAAQGLIGIGFAGGGFSQGFVAPYGGRERLFSTNPMSFAVPCGDEGTLLLDFATSGVAHGKVMLAQSKSAPVPQGMMLDKAGRPTTAAADLDAGGVLLPMGLHKGSGLSMMMEIIPNLLAGDRPMSSPEFHFGNPALFMALLPEAFDEATDFAIQVEALKARVKAVKPAAGFEEVLVPGEPEARSYEERVNEGIALPDRVWADLCGVAGELGVCVPPLEA
ncbi:MAG: Ldh family oxidoreductase [Chloroflexi bacterium]|nr:Ldh family oxidoreductase [Chloroflexota bacterium]